MPIHLHFHPYPDPALAIGLVCFMVTMAIFIAGITPLDDEGNNSPHCDKPVLWVGATGMIIAGVFILYRFGKLLGAWA